MSYPTVLSEIRNYLDILEESSTLKTKFTGITAFEFTFDSSKISSSEHVVLFPALKTTGEMVCYLIGDDFDNNTTTNIASYIIEGTTGNFSPIPTGLISGEYQNRINSWNSNKNTMIDNLVDENCFFNRFYIPTTDLRNTTYQAFFAILEIKDEYIADLILFDTDNAHTGTRVYNRTNSCPKVCLKTSRIHADALSL